MPFTTETHPGVHPQPPEQTRGFVLNHTMLRVKDPAVALDFYTRVMGMCVLRRLDFPDMRFSLYFLARPAPGETPPDDAGERTAWTFGQRAVLELTHNWGTEGDAAFRYHDGNAQPQYDVAWRRFQAEQTTEFIAWQAGIVREYAQHPAYGSPAYGSPAYGSPAYGPPAYGPPIDGPVSGT